MGTEEKRKTIDWAAVKRRLQDKFHEEIKGKSDEELREAYLKGIKEDPKDPIIEEIRHVREKLGKEMQKDPQGFMERARRNAIEAGFKIVSPPSLTGKKKSGRSSGK